MQKSVAFQGDYCPQPYTLCKVGFDNLKIHYLD